jgi:hypothetical protein
VSSGVDGGREGGRLDAGLFGPWLERTVAMLGHAPGAGDGSDVPCDGCTACCESSQFVLVEPDEHEARSAIPAGLLFPAPGAPKGYSLLPYDEHGRCPMLRDGACSIYQNRPRTCRAYDCRVLAAAGVDPGPSKPEIAARVRRWEFTIDGTEDERSLGAVRAAAAFLAEHDDDLPDGGPPPTQGAALAVELHDLFLGDGSPDPAEVLVELRRRVSSR